MKLFKKAGALILCAALTFAVCAPGGGAGGSGRAGRGEGGKSPESGDR